MDAVIDPKVPIACEKCGGELAMQELRGKKGSRYLCQSCEWYKDVKPPRAKKVKAPPQDESDAMPPEPQENVPEGAVPETSPDTQEPENDPGEEPQGEDEMATATAKKKKPGAKRAKKAKAAGTKRGEPSSTDICRRIYLKDKKERFSVMRQKAIDQGVMPNTASAVFVRLKSGAIKS